MPDNITFNNGRYEMAFAGSRDAIWHRHGQQVDPSQPLEHTLKAGGLTWKAELRQAYYTRTDGTIVPVPGQFFIARDDNDYVLSPSVTDQYKIHQVDELARAFKERIEADDRFEFSALGSTRGGQQIWFCAKFNGDLTVGGDKHRAYLLSTTTFDKSGATNDNVSFTRSVCENTIVAALGSRTTVKTSHRTQYDADRARRELAAVAQQTERFKAVGDALALQALAKEQVVEFFKSLTGIPFEAKKDDISTRKLNIYNDLWRAYRTTERETASGTAWTALNAVTRYVDHERTVRANGGNEATARFVAANFGSGADMKQKAMGMLMPLIKDKVAVAA